MVLGDVQQERRIMLQDAAARFLAARPQEVALHPAATRAFGGCVVQKHTSVCCRSS